MSDRAGPRRVFAELPQTLSVVDGVRPGRQRAAGGLWGGSAALLVACLAEEHDGPILVVCADDEGSANFTDDLRCFAARQPLRLIAQEIDVEGRPEPTTHGRRVHALRALATGPAPILVCGLAALIDPVPRPRALRGAQVELATGARVDQDALMGQAMAAGLRRVPVVLGPGEVSRRGDILDVFPLGADVALRIEWFDDEIESMRSFDPGTQRSLEVIEQVTLPLGGDDAEAPHGHVLEHVGSTELLVVRHEPLRIDEVQQSLVLHRADAASRIAEITETTTPMRRLDLSSLPSQDIDFKILSAGSSVGSGEADPLGRLRAIRGAARGSVRILCRTEDEQRRLEEIFAHKQVSLEDEKVILDCGALSRGFRIPGRELTVLSNVEFAGVPQSARPRERPALPTKALQSFFELGPGDTVVHAAHGIAVFEGMELIERADSAEDHLRLCFKDDVRLLVPASKIHLVQKYVGAGEASPRLDKLGGKGFAKRVEEVGQSLLDLAADLLEVQSRREQLTREPCPPDPMEDEFLDGFPFTDTPDQAEAWSQIKADLEGDRTSDRLLCGDVGFGKTEVAMRAAFKMAITGRQVAILVPTTVLAEQHGKNFAARMAPHGLEVEVISRFVGAKARKELLARTRNGAVDVLIGTHRILGDDVAFKDLGLVVIDEEQRFGVRHKEHLKRLRLEVDVLTLSATPIPRTLHSAMLGVRNISTLQTPPTGRQEVETKVAYWDPVLIREALHRELAREGQVFVLHNRIETLDALARNIAELAPGARIATGHGKMTATEMEKTVRRFMGGDIDVLVSTTIVENGLDLPRANTMLIDRADMFGLAELHQLRGRVGRSNRKASCYLLIHRERPPSQDARKRLKAVEELNHLGAGFAIAMKDLEIRGAGNLLGPQQSGHIAAVGYEMYVDLLRGAVEAARDSKEAAPGPRVREVDVDLRLAAFLPETVAQDPKERLELLREMDGAIDAQATAALGRSLVDRLGRLPTPVANLLQVFLLKHVLLDHGVLAVQFTGEDRVIVRHPPGQPLGGAWLDAFGEVRAVEAGKTHLMLPRRRGRDGWTGEQVLELLLQALLGKATVADLRRSWSPRRRRKK